MLYPSLILGLMGVVGALPAPENTPARSVFDPEAVKAAAAAANPLSFPSYQTGGLIRANSSAAANPNPLNKRCALGVSPTGECCATSSIFTAGDIETGGFGIEVQNDDAPGTYNSYYFYENNCDSVPYKHTSIFGGETSFITLPSDFQGRMQRGTDAEMLTGRPQTLGTWFEFNWTNGVAWADISLIRGCDGPMAVYSLDGSEASKGWRYPILDSAPAAGFVAKPDGQQVLGPTEDGGAGPQIVAYEISAVGANNVYVDDSHGSPVIESTNGRFMIVVPFGRA